MGIQREQRLGIRVKQIIMRAKTIKFVHSIHSFIDKRPIVYIISLNRPLGPFSLWHTSRSSIHLKEMRQEKWLWVNQMSPGLYNCYMWFFTHILRQQNTKLPKIITLSMANTVYMQWKEFSMTTKHILELEVCPIHCDVSMSFVMCCPLLETPLLGGLETFDWRAYC